MPLLRTPPYECRLRRWTDNIVRAQRPARLPVVLAREEVALLLSRLRGPVWIMASLMYDAAEAAGVRGAPGQGRQLRPLRVDRPRRKGRQGSRDDAAGGRASAARGTHLERVRG